MKNFLRNEWNYEHKVPLLCQLKSQLWNQLPSGVAIYGIHVLDKVDVQSGVAAAVEAAHKRAHELAKSDNPQ